MMYMSGAKVGFYSGNIKKLMEDVKELKPTLLIAVPRILYRIYDKVKYRIGVRFDGETSVVKAYQI